MERTFFGETQGIFVFQALQVPSWNRKKKKNRKKIRFNFLKYIESSISQNIRNFFGGGGGGGGEEGGIWKKILIFGPESSITRKIRFFLGKTFFGVDFFYVFSMSWKVA